MKRYKTITVANAGAGESLGDGLDKLGARDRKIIALWFSPDWTNPCYNDVHGRAKVGQTEVVDFYLGHFMDLDTTDDKYIALSRRLPVDINLKSGESFQVGFHRTTVGTGGNITIEYEEA